MKKNKIILLLSVLLNVVLAFFTYRYWSHEQLREKESERSFKFDTISARVVAASPYVMLGDKYRAEIFLSAFSTSMPFELKVDSTSNPNQSVSYHQGISLFESIPDSEGQYVFSGKLIRKDPAGKEVVSYPFITEYFVARPQAIIVPAEFVLYRGKENKLSISIPGVAPDDLSVLSTNGSSQKAGIFYSLIPGKEDKCVITVAFKNSKGEYTKLDQKEYKVVDK